jgi:hypothetical protein
MKTPQMKTTIEELQTEQLRIAELHPILLGSSPFAHAKSGATILKSKGGEWQGLKLVVTASSKGAMDMLEKAADGSTRDELTMAEITDVLAARFDVTATSSSGGSAVGCYTQKTLAELHPVLLGSSPFAHAKSGATILKSKDGEWQGLKLVVTGSSDEAIELLEKAADGSTRDELTTTEITDVLAARFDVTVTSSSDGSAVVCYTQKTLAELHPMMVQILANSPFS